MNDRSNDDLAKRMEDLGNRLDDWGTRMIHVGTRLTLFITVPIVVLFVIIVWLA